MNKTKSKPDEGIDLYSLTNNPEILEEIDNLAIQARKKKLSINRLEIEYKSLSTRFKTLLYSYGKPKKLVGPAEIIDGVAVPTWTAIRQTRSTESINRDKLQQRMLQEKGMKVEKVLEIIAYATEVETTEYYVLRGKKEVEEVEEADNNGDES